MKIIDNKKDYYDYLQGVLGQDTKAVFDRRGSVLFNAGSMPVPFRKVTDPDIAWTGMLILVAGKKLYATNFVNLAGRFSLGVMTRKEVKREGTIPLRMRIEYRQTKPDKLHANYYNLLLTKQGSPVMPQLFPMRSRTTGRVTHEDDYFKSGEKEHSWDCAVLSYDNPILSTLFTSPIVPAEELFTEIQDFLLSLNDKEIVDGRTDEQKLESAGFDKKTSFRKQKRD